MVAADALQVLSTAEFSNDLYGSGSATRDD